MRKLTDKELISVYFAINVHNEYFFNGLMYLKNTEYEINQAFELMEVFEAVGPFGEIIGATTNDEDGFERLFKNGLEVARAVKYGDYDFTEPYIYLGNDGNLYSMDEDEFLAMLKDNKDELMEAYDDLVSDGCIEDFLKEE
jgi:hypothetical protein